MCEAIGISLTIRIICSDYLGNVSLAILRNFQSCGTIKRRALSYMKRFAPPRLMTKVSGEFADDCKVIRAKAVLVYVRHPAFIQSEFYTNYDEGFM